MATNGEFMRPILMSVIVLIISGFLGIKYLAAGRSGSGEHSQQKADDLPLGERHTRPKLSLESALKIAQTFVQKQHSDSSSYWLVDARFILYGGNDIPDEKKSQCWAFKWMNDTKGPPSIYIVVSMDGEPMEIPSI
jgi:hypothetical protein